MINDNFRDTLITQSYTEIGKAVMTLLTVPDYVNALRRYKNHLSLFSLHPPDEVKQIIALIPEELRAAHCLAMKDIQESKCLHSEEGNQTQKNNREVSASGSDSLPLPASSCSCEQRCLDSSVAPSDCQDHSDPTVG